MLTFVAEIEASNHLLSFSCAEAWLVGFEVMKLARVTMVKQLAAEPAFIVNLEPRKVMIKVKENVHKLVKPIATSKVATSKVTADKIITSKITAKSCLRIGCSDKPLGLAECGAKGVYNYQVVVSKALVTAVDRTAGGRTAGVGNQ